MKKKIKVSLLAIVLIIIFAILFFSIEHFSDPTFNKITDWVKENNGEIYINDTKLVKKLPSEVSELSREFLGTNYVSIYFQKTHPIDFSLLSHIPNLDTFVLHTQYQNKTFSMKNLSKNLMLLDLFINSTLQDIHYLEHLVNLEALKLHCNSDELRHLKPIEKLQLLELVGNSKGIYNLSEISNLKKLETFAITKAKISNLDKLTANIECLDLSFSEFSTEDLTKFTNLKQFTFLTNKEVTHFNDFCIKLIKTSPEIEIVVDPNFISTEELEKLNDDDLIKLIDHFEKPYSPLKKLLLKMYTIMAERDHPKSIYKLGLTYLDGVKKNKPKALKLFKKSANLGYLKAKGHLGVYYILGDSIPQDIPKGLKLLEKNVVEESHKPSAKYLVFMYLNGVKFGKGVKPNIDKANYWYKKHLEIGGDKIDHKDLIQPRRYNKPRP